MRLVPVAALALAALALAAHSASPQSLTEAAAKEKERRKAAAAHAKAKVYTDGDLGKGKSGVSDAGTDAAPAADAAKEGAAKEGAPAGAAKKEKSPDEIRAEQQKAWRERVQQANDNITKLNARIETLQRAVNDVAQNLYGSTRTAQLNELEQAQKQLADANKALSDLEEEGRRNGFR